MTKRSSNQPSQPLATQIREGLESDWRRLRAWSRKPGNVRRASRWLVFVPALFIIWIAFMYAGVAAGFTSPERIILGAKGIEILDRNGEIIYTFSDEPGSSRIVPLEEISPHLINATIAAEDANFWDNPGVNVKGLARATYENLAFWENGGFFKGSGGSSLSQQLAKNLYIKPEDRAKRSPLRKIKETIIAFELNRRYSKEQILQWYLSNVFYGHGAYGVESASYRYFNKPPIELTLAEATLLAGIPRAPSLYDPIGDFERATQRQEQVLYLMVRHGLLTPEESATALQEPLALREGRNPNVESETDQIAPHFALYVKELLPQILGRESVEGQQLRVMTTLDASLQTKAEEIVTSNLDRLEQQVGATNGALVSMDPRTGEILAMVGSHDFERDDISGQVNNATSLNQPGSTIKPVTYLAAFMKGWSPASIVVDEPMRITDGESPYTLANADNRYRGSVPVRTALGSSLNVPAVKALEYAGLSEVHDLAKRMGLTTLEDISNYGPAFTLGGVDVTLLDMTYVYSVFANQGEHAGMSSVLGLPSGSRDLDPIAVLQVETVDGKVIWRARERKERVVPANAAYLVTNVLSDDRARVSMFGANSPLNLPGRPAAVKSGSSDNSRDAWAIGFTPELVTGVWVGNANNAPMPGATSTYTAAPIWAAFMTAALQGQRPTDFPVPEGIQFVDVCAATGQAPTAGCGAVVREPFLAGRTPQGASSQPRARQPARETFVPGGLLTPTPPPRPPPAGAATPRTTLTPRVSPTSDASPREATPRPSRTPEPAGGGRGGGDGNDEGDDE
ncbi:MAG: penicillin-binding protein [Dehalococcoidia bacterium]|nr:penicillin-binding protein [Dehalococcoidia bacterium]